MGFAIRWLALCALYASSAFFAPVYAAAALAKLTVLSSRPSPDVDSAVFERCCTWCLFGLWMALDEDFVAALGVWNAADGRHRFMVDRKP